MDLSKDDIAERREFIAPPGKLNLPPLLEQRRLQYAIPDGAFRRQAMGWRVLLWQIPMWEGDRFQGTSIHMTDQTKSRKVDEAPRGVIVSAGLEALDYLRTNGSEIGQIVNFLQLGPWRLPCDMIQGRQQYLVIAHGGDLIADEDLGADLLESFAARPVWSPELDCHVYPGAAGAHPKRAAQNSY